MIYIVFPEITKQFAISTNQIKVLHGYFTNSL